VGTRKGREKMETNSTRAHGKRGRKKRSGVVRVDYKDQNLLSDTGLLLERDLGSEDDPLPTTKRFTETLDLDDSDREENGDPLDLTDVFL